MIKILLQLEPYNCPSCVKKMEQELLTYKGVQSIKVFPSLYKIRTVLNEKDMSLKELESIIKDFGLCSKVMQIKEVNSNLGGENGKPKKLSSSPDN